MRESEEELDKQPKELQEKVFNKLYAEAKMARFSKTELKEYEDSLKAYRDIKNSIDSAEEKGRAEGRAEGRTEGKVETARNLLTLDIPIDTIMKATGLTEEEIKAISD